VQFDLSSDDRTMLLVSGSDDSAKRGIWVAPLDRSAAPRRVFEGNTDRAYFDPAGNIYFPQIENSGRFLHRLRAPDYISNERVADDHLWHVFSISPDGDWVIALSTFAANAVSQLVAISTHGLPTRGSAQWSGHNDCHRRSATEAVARSTDERTHEHRGLPQGSGRARHSETKRAARRVARSAVLLRIHGRAQSVLGGAALTSRVQPCSMWPVSLARPNACLKGAV
jgi:hypothetical protein